ncbi:C40 family peptidase [Streptomyces sp. 5-6(2022)]|uniref:C40 family peptidase n=1 Tax=Streptomyces sp. 5-6(2022) TaxID=2936510 RepID=UPI0023B93D5B|nr:C40 family peptidase [Streptomyces sp. 5-6(2022)]
MAKIGISILGAVLLVVALAAAGASSVLSVFGGSAGSQPSHTALTDIPPDYLTLYQQAATTCPGLDWSIPAAIGKVETDHGRSTLPGVHSAANAKGAKGPMQFLQPTFDAVTAKHPVPQQETRAPSPYDPRDAIYTAVAYLCDSGARGGRNLHQAILTYNPAEWYVAKVLAQAQDYQNPSSLAGTTEPSPAARKAIDYAEGQLGLPYEWGGNGPTDGDAGFDCSGLTKAAYAAAGINLPRTAEEQFHADPRVPQGKPLAPGDLVFYGTPDEGIHHVGLYIGQGQMINAPNFGQKIKIAPYRHQGDDYAGATRPAQAAVRA